MWIEVNKDLGFRKHNISLLSLEALHKVERHEMFSIGRGFLKMLHIIFILSQDSLLMGLKDSLSVAMNSLVGLTSHYWNPNCSKYLACILFHNQEISPPFKVMSFVRLVMSKRLEWKICSTSIDMVEQLSWADGMSKMGLTNRFIVLGLENLSRKYIPFI